MSAFLVGVQVDRTTQLGLDGSPQAQKMRQNAHTNQIGLCPCSNSIVWGHPSLKSPMECLHHVRFPC